MGWVGLTNERKVEGRMDGGSRRERLAGFISKLVYTHTEILARLCSKVQLPVSFRFHDFNAVSFREYAGKFSLLYFKIVR